MRDNLRKARQKRGLSQVQIANKLNVTQQTVSKHELGIADPSTFAMIRLYEKILKVPARELFPDIFI